MTTHAANLATSRRLQNTLDCLSDGCWHSAFELAQRTKSVAVHSDCSELRANGIPVEQEYNGESENGRRISQYRLRLGQPSLL